MQLERLIRCFPPPGNALILRPGLEVVLVSRKTKLHIITRQFPLEVGEILHQIHDLVTARAPLPIRLLSIRISMGHDPPLIILEKRPIGGKSG